MWSAGFGLPYVCVSFRRPYMVCLVFFFASFFLILFWWEMKDHHFVNIKRSIEFVKQETHCFEIAHLLDKKKIFYTHHTEKKKQLHHPFTSILPLRLLPHSLLTLSLSLSLFLLSPFSPLSLSPFSPLSLLSLLSLSLIFFLNLFTFFVFFFLFFFQWRHTDIEHRHDLTLFQPAKVTWSCLFLKLLHHISS